ncbi:MAG: malto-oligosyltrehalose trehalohydrolase [Dermatophilaceae bacterium]
MRLRVWAPHAHDVRVVLGAPGSARSEQAMAAGPDGWWGLTVEDGAAYPVDYAFRVDGGDPTPDPRSGWQPYGVHGPSRTVDTGAFEWTDAGWPGPRGGAGVLGAVHYELHVGTFTPEGTLDAAVGRLGHLVDLGVDVVGLMPVAAFPGRWGWGYDGVAPYAVHDGYGGPHALARFVDAAHASGLGVSLDVVYNHLGPVGNYLSRFGPYFTDRHTTPWGPGVNLDGPGCEQVRAWIIDNALRWLRDFHLDALRLDAVHELIDDSPRHVLAELSDSVAALATRLGRPLALIAESDLNDATTVTPTSEGGLGMSCQWDDDVHHALHTALTGEAQGYYADFAQGGVLAKTLTEVFLHDGRFSSFRGRLWGAAVDRARVDGRRFLAYLQTHDQVGNRALGDRINPTLTPGQQAIGAAVYLLSAFTPMVFMGEEWAASTPWLFFTDFDDADGMAASVREGRRAEFAEHGWVAEEIPDPQDPATRAASVLDWSEVHVDGHSRMLDWYRALIALRRSEPDLHDGRLDRVQVDEDPRAGWFTVRRGAILLAVNFSAEPARVPAVLPADGEVLLHWAEGTIRSSDNGVRLGGHDVAVFRAASPTV